MATKQLSLADSRKQIMKLLMDSEKISAKNLPGIDQYPAITASKYINTWDNIAAIQFNINNLKQRGQRV